MNEGQPEPGPRVTRAAAHALCVEHNRLLLCRLAPEEWTSVGHWTLPGGGQACLWSSWHRWRLGWHSGERTYTRLVADPLLELHSLVICDYAMTAQDGKISAIGIFGGITVGGLPSVHGRLFIVAVLEADPGSHELTLQVISPSGQPMLPLPPTMRLDVPPNTTTANIVANLEGLQVRELGRHRVELRAGDRVLGMTPFNVNLAWNQPQSGNA